MRVLHSSPVVRAAVILLLLCESAYAQHSHGRRNTIEIPHDTVPQHDEVLPDAPDNLILRFGEYVRLVKLTLKAEDKDTIDVGFSYNPDVNRVFIQNIPDLPPATYYTAEWAAVNQDNIMVFGFFCFSFGPDAVVPTTVIPVDDSIHIMVPDYRLLQGNPP